MLGWLGRPRHRLLSENGEDAAEHDAEGEQEEGQPDDRQRVHAQQHRLQRKLAATHGQAGSAGRPRAGARDS